MIFKLSRPLEIIIYLRSNGFNKLPMISRRGKYPNTDTVCISILILSVEQWYNTDTLGNLETINPT